MEADTTAQVLTRPTDMVKTTNKDNGEQRTHNLGNWEPGARNETRQSGVGGNETSSVMPGRPVTVSATVNRIYDLAY